MNHNIIDPKLTFNGIKQCKILKEQIIFDKLDDKLETSVNIFNNLINKVNFICLDEIREHNDKPCHKRKKKY